MNVSLGTVTSDVGASGACSTRLAWVMRCLCLTGLGISLYLAWTALNMVPVFGCSAGDVFNCDHVLTSKWSKVLGVPVSVPAAGVYATLLVMLSFVRRPAPRALTQMLWNSMTVCACMAGLAALWFIGLQVFVLKHYCQYCLAAHGCSLMLAILLLQNRVTSGYQKSLIASFSFLAVASMVGLQVMTPQEDHFEVVRYDDVTAEEASATAASDEADLFAAPGDVFEAPGEVFEAPGSEPETDSASVPSVESSRESVNADAPQPVAATVLLIVPPRVLMLSNLLSGLPQESTVQEAKPESSDTDESQSAAATEPTAEPAKPEPPKRRVVTVAGNRVTLDVRQWPLLGKPEARYIFVEMFDYTCPHCRNTHFAIKGAFDQFGDDLAILALPVPLERACNDAAGGGHPGACELAKISIAVWRANPSKFHEFHDWMFEGSRSQSAAKAHAEKLVGVEKFRKEYGSTIPSEYVKRHVDLYKKVGQGAVPKLLFPKSTMNGEINNKATLVGTIERELKDVARE